MTERWLPIPEYEGLYDVSDQGRVRSHGFRVRAKGGATAFRAGRILHSVRKINGYLQVTLIGHDRRRRSCQVHQLVCATFLGPASPEQQVCHWNGDRSDNRLENLRYGTAADNAADRARHGNFVCNLPGLEWCSSP